MLIKTIGQLINELKKYDENREIIFTSSGYPNIINSQIEQRFGNNIHIQSAKLNFSRFDSIKNAKDGEEPIEFMLW